VLSIVKTVLPREPDARFTLVYANRDIRSIMFREELEDLKNCHIDRLSVLHILKADTQEMGLFTGRVDAEKLGILFRHWVDPATVDMAFICGPPPMMHTVAASLRQYGLGEDRIRYELFDTPVAPHDVVVAPRRRVPCPDGVLEATVTLDGTTLTFAMPRCGTSLLDAALEQDLVVPFACRAGVCSTCRAKVLEGEFEMLENHALDEQELAQGYVLACQCFPTGERIRISFDE
jgi:ring-1,2-phenylacetyl-CoA epoxidase subunit PaaE